ncbi:MAG: serine/threonine protein kinase [Elusimicrobia bacterium]|nr:MAG: serine/threonine protein kinase [Elusimicrobiota bacterium]
MSRRVGRFEILRELGRGAQSVVYLARDPHLQRQVAIKTLHFSRSDAQQNQQLLEEARLVSQLRHPSIVPIFEAGEEKGDLYLVFQYVPGKNLAEYLRANGAMPAAKAIALMQPVLEAIAHAHAAGIIHRDLKPSNILIDDEGRPRVMDFGIATRREATSSGGGQLVGTPAYMAPEYIVHRQISERSDLFSAGLVLYELLTGKRAVPGTDSQQVMERLANHDIVCSPDVSEAIDERLAHLLYRVLARDPQERFASANELRAALDNYLTPAVSAPAGDGTQSTIEFLLRRMKHKSDFPALSESVGAINRITSLDTQNLSDVSNAILKDFSLTNKILRVVNSVYYRQAGGGNISTVSRAVVVLGLDAVRSIAITVMLFDHLQNKRNAHRLKEEFVRANFAALLAKEFGSRVTTGGESEELYICAMFHNLGRLLSHYYFPDESAEIARAVQQKSLTEDHAALQVLGVSYEELGVAIAESWGFPRLIVSSMHRLPEGPVRQPETGEDNLRLLSALSNELCDLVADTAPDPQQRGLQKIAARYAEAVSIDPQEVQRTLNRSFEQVTQFAATIHLNLQQTHFGQQIRRWEAGAAPIVVSEVVAARANGVTGALFAESTPDTAPYLPPAADDNGLARDALPSSEVVLLAGIQDVSNALVSDFKLNDVMRIILETMYRAKGFQRVILCSRDARSNQMVGRFGFGPDANDVARRFHFPLAFKPDIFHAALANGVDILISDTRDTKIAARIPAWFQLAVGAETFVVFPLCLKSSPLAMIYADAGRAGELTISEKELSLLRTLRNQAVLAIKQSL